MTESQEPKNYKHHRFDSDLQFDSWMEPCISSISTILTINTFTESNQLAHIKPINQELSATQINIHLRNVIHTNEHD